MRHHFSILISLLCLIFSPLDTFSEGIPFVTGKMLSSGSITVDGQANIYGAGQSVAPAPGGGGEGLLPPSITLEQTESLRKNVLIFSSINGEISCTTTNLYNNADGANHCLGRTETESLNGLSGIQANRSMFLVGVFLSDTEPSPPVPQAFIYLNNYNSEEPPETNHEQFGYDYYDEASHNPQLNQLFFIGDGHYEKDEKTEIQYFSIPHNATRLYLGFVDTDESGLVGYFNDNLGELSVSYEIYSNYNDQIANEPHPPSLDDGLRLYYTFDDTDYTKPSIEGIAGCSDLIQGHSNLGDSGVLGFHGELSCGWGEESEVKFTYNNAKYGKAIKMVKAHIRVVHPSPDKGKWSIYTSATGFPLGYIWSISTWFVYDSDYPDFQIVSSGYQDPYHGRYVSYCLATINENNPHELCGLSTIGNFDRDVHFNGINFFMDTLDEGWHHMAIIGESEKIKFYIDGTYVEESNKKFEYEDVIYDYSSEASSYLTRISAYMLDDFRVYTRVLTQSEIYLLAERTDTPPESPFSDDCLATYADDGTLHIPCLALPENLNDKNIYDVILEQQPDSFSFDLDIETMIPK